MGAGAEEQTVPVEIQHAIDAIKAAEQEYFKEHKKTHTNWVFSVTRNLPHIVLARNLYVLMNGRRQPLVSVYAITVTTWCIMHEVLHPHLKPNDVILNNTQFIQRLCFYVLIAAAVATVIGSYEKGHAERYKAFRKIYNENAQIIQKHAGSEDIQADSQRIRERKFLTLIEPVSVDKYNPDNNWGPVQRWSAMTPSIWTQPLYPSPSKTGTQKTISKTQ